MKTNKSKNLVSEDTLQSIMEERFGRYSKYIIQDRALPDVRDGLKPVQRRALYAMWLLNLKPNKPYKKSARVVGDVIGKYHPHGDSSVYASMVRMAQNWKMSHVLVDMHGNKGSIDGDPAAAMRYTEVRLSNITTELLEEIDKNTVPFILNFDDSELEPVVLPAYYSNFIVNGAKGIASGYATESPPHNLGEVIDATKALIVNPLLSTKKLLSHIKGPDFPTGATIYGIDEIYRAYETGKGRLLVRATIEVDKKQKNKTILKVTDIPFEADKPLILRKIEEIIIGKKIAGLKNVRDESDRRGISIIIELEGNVQNPSTIVQYLYKYTGLQSYYNINMVAIADRRPTILSLSQALLHHIAHMKEVVERKSIFQLNKAQNRKTIIEGLIKAISILDEVIAVIRRSKNKSDAIANLIKEFDFLELQATAIVNLRLYRLTSTDIVELQTEQKELTKLIRHLKKLLKNKEYLNNHLLEKLDDIKNKYAVPRKTKIVGALPSMTFNISDVVKDEEIGLIITRDGFLKRITIDNFNEHKNSLPEVKDNDSIVFKSKCMVKSNLLLITSLGNFVSLFAYKLTSSRWASNGEHINLFSHVEPNEKIVSVIVVPSFQDLKEETLVIASKNGMVKRSYLKDFQTSRQSKSITCMKIKDDDEVISAFVSSSENEKVFFIRSDGSALKYSMSLVPISGLRTVGAKGIKTNLEKKVTFSSNDLEKAVICFYRERALTVWPKNISKGKKAAAGSRVISLNSKKHKCVGAIQPKSDDVITIISETGNSKVIFAKEIVKKITQSENYKFSNKFGLFAGFVKSTSCYKFDSIRTKNKTMKNVNNDDNSQEDTVDIIASMEKEFNKEKVSSLTKSTPTKIETTKKPIKRKTKFFRSIKNKLDDKPKIIVDQKPQQENETITKTIRKKKKDEILTPTKKIVDLKPQQENETITKTSRKKKEDEILAPTKKVVQKMIVKNEDKKTTISKRVVKKNFNKDAINEEVKPTKPIKENKKLISKSKKKASTKEVAPLDELKKEQIEEKVVTRKTKKAELKSSKSSPTKPKKENKETNKKESHKIKKNKNIDDTMDKTLVDFSIGDILDED